MRGPTPATTLVAAFASVYLIWGSTYLAIRFAIETLPPFLMASVRFLVAGAILYLVTRVRGAPRPTRRHWAAATLIGGLLLLGGNGGVVWAQQYVPSGVAALIVATIPLWMAFLPFAAGRGTKKGPRIVAGILIGFAGGALLIGPATLFGDDPIHAAGAVALLLSTLAWSIGSLVSGRVGLPASSLQASALQMLAGGALLGIAGLVTGEADRLDVANVSGRSLAALGYLILFGAVIGYSAYGYILKHAAPALASTYAYVNPVIAVFLGWWLADEPLGPRTLLAAATILFGVVLILWRPLRRVVPTAPAAPHPAPAGD